MHTYNPVTQKEETLVNTTRLKDAVDGLKADTTSKVGTVAQSVATLAARVDELRQAAPVVQELHAPETSEGFMLKHHTIYRVTQGDASYDFSTVTVQEFSTAEIHVLYDQSMGEIVWNPDWEWLHGSAPSTFTTGYIYCFIARNDGYGTMANLAYERLKPVSTEV